jgi:hypothetical protein
MTLNNTQVGINIRKTSSHALLQQDIPAARKATLTKAKACQARTVENSCRADLVSFLTERSCPVFFWLNARCVYDHATAPSSNCILEEYGIHLQRLSYVVFSFYSLRLDVAGATNYELCFDTRDRW